MPIQVQTRKLSDTVIEIDQTFGEKPKDKPQKEVEAEGKEFREPEGEGEIEEEIEDQEPVGERSSERGDDRDELAEVIEAEARRRGWQSPEERTKKGIDPGVSAAEFIKRGQYISKDPKELAKLLSEKDRSVTRLQQEVMLNSQAMLELQAHYNRQREVDRQKLIKELTEQRNKALVEEGDEVKAVKLDEEIHKARTGQEGPIIPVPAKKIRNIDIPPDAPPEFEEFVKENSWFGADRNKTEYAKAYAQYLRGTGEKMKDVDFYKAIVEKTEKEFARKKAPPISGRRGEASARKDKYTLNDLDSNSRKIAEKFINNGMVGEMEYMEGLVATGYFDKK